jgi:hypothetical protein
MHAACSDFARATFGNLRRSLFASELQCFQTRTDWAENAGWFVGNGFSLVASLQSGNHLAASLCEALT